MYFTYVSNLNQGIHANVFLRESLKIIFKVIKIQVSLILNISGLTEGVNVNL